MRKCAEVYERQVGEEVVLGVVLSRNFTGLRGEPSWEEVVFGVVLSVAQPVQDAVKEEKKYS